jgi:osmoprotectant transport system ATP-binding protein
VLRMINRLIEPTSGRIVVDGDDIAGIDVVQLRRRIGYVIQKVGLFPHQTVATNVATVPRLLGWDRRRTRDRVEELLGLVGLDPGEYANRYPAQLSGGQQQRVGVARALAADPPVLLMDEPFGAIDPVTRGRLQDEFRRLQDVLHKTVVFVTHDIDEALKMGDRIAVLNTGGHLEQYEQPAKLLAEPSSPFVAGFVGSDRGLRRLRLEPIRRDVLEPLPAPPAGSATNGDIASTVDIGASLADALSAILLSGDGRVVVTEHSRPLGVLTLDGVQRSSRP